MNPYLTHAKKNKKNPGLGEMFSFLILPNPCLQRRCGAERHLVLSEKG